MCYTSLQKEPASALRVTLQCTGGTWVDRCKEKATMPEGYIPQRKLPSASSSGSPDFIECAQCCRMVDSVPIKHTISILNVPYTVGPSVDAGEMMMPA